MSIGDAVLVEPIAFEYVGIRTDSVSTGIIINIRAAREYFNLDTDENLCEVLLSDGSMELFYEIDLKILN